VTTVVLFLKNLQPMSNQRLTSAYLGDLWRWKCGLREEIKDIGFMKKDIKHIDGINALEDINKIYKTEFDDKFKKIVIDILWSNPFPSIFVDEFFNLMNNRLTMASFRYGRLQKKKGVYDYIGGIKRYFEEFVKTGNMEFLVDASNYCLLEFHENNNSTPNHELLSKIIWGNMSSSKPMYFRESHILVADLINKYKNINNNCYIFVISAICCLLYISNDHPLSHFTGLDEKGFHCSTN